MKEMKQMSFDELVGGCLYTISREIEEAPQPRALIYEFRERMLSGVNMLLDSVDADANPTAMTALLLEEFMRSTAKMLVCLAAIGPSALRSNDVITVEAESLIRRDIEDKLLESVGRGLKQAVLHEHAGLSEYRKGK